MEALLFLPETNASLSAASLREVARNGGVTRCVLHLAEVSPFGDAAQPAWTSMIELAGAPAAIAAVAARGGTLLPVAATVVKDDRPRRPGQPDEGINLLALMTARAGMPASEIDRHWAEHRPLALAVHHGMDRYIQFRALAADARYDGVAMLHFPTPEDLRSRLFRSPDDVALINDDVAAFIADHAVMYTSEQVII